jgi:hypothetical protein
LALNKLDRSTPVVDESGRPRQNLQMFSEELANMQLIIGTGSPEGQYEARQGREYMDQAGSTGNIKWIKKLSDIGGNKSLGWVLV